MKYPTLESLEESEVDERLESIDNIFKMSGNQATIQSFLIHEYMKVLLEYREQLVKK